MSGKNLFIGYSPVAGSLLHYQRSPHVNYETETTPRSPNKSFILG